MLRLAGESASFVWDYPIHLVFFGSVSVLLLEVVLRVVEVHVSHSEGGNFEARVFFFLVQVPGVDILFDLVLALSF